MQNDPLGLKGVMSLIGLFLLIICGVCVVYRAELMESIQSNINPFKAEHVRVLRSSDSSALRGYELRPLRNDIGLVSVERLVLEKQPSGRVQLTFQMTNAGGTNDYPNIKVTWRRGDLITRTETFAPKDYSPSGRFTSMKVILPTAPAAGDTGATVDPFYGESP
tara:strand:+ start:104 stop:595 length:492 start_codon:yes stop_codon:yes gene_type:complete